MNRLDLVALFMHPLSAEGPVPATFRVGVFSPAAPVSFRPAWTSREPGELSSGKPTDRPARRYRGRIVYYPGPRIVVTDRRIVTDGDSYLIEELSIIEAVHYLAHPARRTALACGAIELGLALPLALTYGVFRLVWVSLIAAVGLGAAVLLDGRRNPRWMVLRAVYRGRIVSLFGSRNRQEFEQVRRAVMRAVEISKAQRG